MGHLPGRTARAGAAALVVLAVAGEAGCGRLDGGAPPGAKADPPPALAAPAQQTRPDERAEPAKPEAASTAKPADEPPAAEEAANEAADGEGEEKAKPAPRKIRASAAAQRRRARASSHGAEPGAPSAAPLRVTRLVVAKKVSGREPVGVARSFSTAEAPRVFAFVELTNDARSESEIAVVFTPPGGGAAHRVQLDVGASPRWRTWATLRSTRARGTWTAAVHGADGRVLARTTFDVTP